MCVKVESHLCMVTYVGPEIVSGDNIASYFILSIITIGYAGRGGGQIREVEVCLT